MTVVSYTIPFCHTCYTGKVVLGDPKAISIVNIDFAGGHILVTPSAHYIPTSNPDLSSKTHKHQSPKRARKLQQSPSLPGLCISCELLDISISKPMYSGNASEEVPQEVQIRAQHDQIEVGIVTVRSLSDALKDRSSVMGESATRSSVKQMIQKSCLRFGKCFCMPKVELNYNSKTSGDVASGSSYLQVDVESITCIGSLEQISHSLYVSGSWLQNEPLSSLAELKIPHSLKVSPKLSHQLHALFKSATLTRSTSERYSSISAVLGEASMSVLKRLGQGTVDHCIHVFHGPVSTSEWNTVDCYRHGRSQNGDHSRGPDRFIQFFMATPADSVKGIPNACISLSLDMYQEIVVCVIETSIPTSVCSLSGMHCNCKLEYVFQDDLCSTMFFFMEAVMVETRDIVSVLFDIMISAY